MTCANDSGTDSPVARSPAPGAPEQATQDHRREREDPNQSRPSPFANDIEDSSRKRSAPEPADGLLEFETRVADVAQALCVTSFSRHRRSRRRTLAGVAAGSIVQSGSRSRTAASVSETVSPSKACGRSASRTGRSRRPRYRRACPRICRAPARGSYRRRCRA